MPEMPSTELATCIRAISRNAFEVVQHLGHGLIVCGFLFLMRVNLFVDEMYLPVALKVSVGLKSEMHLKENMKPLILVTPET